MGKGRDPYQAALSALSRFVAEGRFGWGHPLVATGLAAELRLSPTPVREAMARLAGEGVIQHLPGRGYFAPSPTAADIVGLHDLHRRYLLWRAETALPAPERAAGMLSALEAKDVEGVFDQWMADGDDILRQAWLRTSTRLRPVRVIEGLIDEAGPAELAGLAEAVSRQDHTGALELIETYHRRRAALADKAVALMRRSAERIVQI